MAWSLLLPIFLIVTCCRHVSPCSLSWSKSLPVSCRRLLGWLYLEFTFLSCKCSVYSCKGLPWYHELRLNSDEHGGSWEKCCCSLWESSLMFSRIGVTCIQAKPCLLKRSYLFHSRTSLSLSAHTLSVSFAFIARYFSWFASGKSCNATTVECQTSGLYLPTTDYPAQPNLIFRLRGQTSI